MTTAPVPLSVRHHPWARPLSPVSIGDPRPSVALTDRYLLLGGTPVIPVSGEIHYSRTPRHRWDDRLRQMRAGGVTVAASYVFWNHHAARPGTARFDGNLDVAAFVDRCAAAGLEVILRIGPWCHGESRNGGFPDWVQHAPVRHRTDDPGYLDLVRKWFGQLATALDGRCSPAGTVLGLQLENELYDQPGHLVTLKRLAREAGLSAPLWTATAWGGAELPPGEVLPLYGGYGDGFWVDSDAAWDPTFRDHFFFSHVWDDPGIGADVRVLHEARTSAVQPRTPSALFPPATCELGGGMGTAYHRRPHPAALDVAAVAHCKIGNGSAWQGYYMYAGGTNPPGEHGLQESHATGYPNDLPRLGYDFHAPIGEAGTLAPSHAHLRRQHAFLTAFGPQLADMPSSLPDRRPAGVEDAGTLRWALRSDGDSGFLFVAWHQPHVPLQTYRGARFRLRLNDADLVLPSHPVDIAPGTLARWPIGLTAGGVRLDWVTASVLTLLPGDTPTLVLTADEGVTVEAAVGGALHALTPGLEPARFGGLDLLVLPAPVTPRIWVCEDGGRRLLLSDDDLSWGPDGKVEARGTNPAVQVYEPGRRRFVELPLEPAQSPPPVAAPAVAASAPVTAAAPVAASAPALAPFSDLASVETIRRAGRTVPVAYGKRDGRQSAPAPEVFDELAAVHRLTLPGWAADPGLDALLQIDWAGDVAQLRLDGRTVTDRFWDGSRWIVNLTDSAYRTDSVVTLHVLPLAAGSTVGLPAGARDRLRTCDGQLLAVDSVQVIGRPAWRER